MSHQPLHARSASYAGIPSLHRPDVRSQLVGRNRAYLAALAQLERYARHEHTVVLLEGESGTGKSYFARHLHDRSARARGPYQVVVLSTLDDNLAASELFGHVSGAYTDARQPRPGRFVSAQGGTLFLDEIGKASSAVQRKLLHVIEHRELWPVGADRAVRVDVRLVAATNVPLETLAEQGGFLADLVPRLSGFRVRLPPLRERAEDVPLLVARLVESRAAQCGYGDRRPAVDPELMEVLQAAPWPGNVRQLDATVQRMLVDADGAERLTIEHLGADVVSVAGLSAGEPLTAERIRLAVQAAGSVSGAARTLGVSRATLYRHLGAAGNEEAERAG